jgi:hypothetical protein
MSAPAFLQNQKTLFPVWPARSAGTVSPWLMTASLYYGSRRAVLRARRHGQPPFGPVALPLYHIPPFLPILPAKIPFRAMLQIFYPIPCLKEPSVPCRKDSIQRYVIKKHCAANSALHRVTKSHPTPPFCQPEEMD